MQGSDLVIKRIYSWSAKKNMPRQAIALKFGRSFISVENCLTNCETYDRRKIEVKQLNYRKNCTNICVKFAAVIYS